jgi:hypothetical protein
MIIFNTSRIIVDALKLKFQLVVRQRKSLRTPDLNIICGLLQRLIMETEK